MRRVGIKVYNDGDEWNEKYNYGKDWNKGIIMGRIGMKV